MTRLTIPSIGTVSLKPVIYSYNRAQVIQRSLRFGGIKDAA